MSAVYRLRFRDSRGVWWFVRVLSLRNFQDALDLTAAKAGASQFISEADAWACAARFRLPAGMVKVQR